jgi:N-acetylmuramoyl-L-alanine amidase
MSVRATSLAFVLGVIALGGAAADERTGTAAVPSRPASDFPVASEVRLAGDDGQTRLIIDLTQKLDIRVFTLANPFRVVIDLPQVTFAFPAKAGEAGRGLVKAFRFGLVMQGGSRMVLDLARPARVEKAVVLEAANDQPARLVLELAAVDREAFMRNIAAESRLLETRKAETAP